MRKLIYQSNIKFYLIFLLLIIGTTFAFAKDDFRSMKKHKELRLPILNDSYVDNLKPKYKYLNNPKNTKEEVNFTGPVRVLSMDGRKGLNPSKLNSRVKIPHHTLNSERGAVVVWYFLLSPHSLGWVNKKDNILSSNPKDIAGFNSHFTLHPNYTKFYKGTIYTDAFEPPQKAFVGSATGPKKKWVQLTITWDKSYNKIRFYENGVLKSTQDPYHLGQYFEKCGKNIYAGSPNVCVGEVKFYDRMLNESAVKNIYKRETPYKLTEEQKEGRTLCEENDEGIPNVSQAKEILKEKEKLEFKPDGKWNLQTSLSLKKPAHLDSFYVQGSPDSPMPTEEGLLVNTPYIQPLFSARQEKEDRSQLYLWTKRPYEGDHLYWEVEFKVLKRNGLSLFMSQVSGPQREDFMQDYPLRTTGRMNIVHWENVRRYIAEYWQEMDDGAQFRTNFKAIPMKWHKLQVLQRGDKFLYAIDGRIFQEKEVNNVLSFGHIALRCMLATKMKFRNFRVYTQPLYDETSSLASDNKSDKANINPAYTYLSNDPRTNDKVSIKGPYRLLEHNGRKGINLESIYSRIKLPKHTLNDNQGSAILWFFPLDKLRNKVNFNDRRLKFLGIADQNPYYNFYPFLFDYSKDHNPFKSNFSLMWKTGQKGLFAKFYQGKFKSGFQSPQKGFASSNYMKFRRNKWYQIGLTWNKNKDDIKIFVNGILVGQENQFSLDLNFERCGDTLYTGNTALCMSEIKFYDRTLSSNQIQKLYTKNRTKKNPRIQEELKTTHKGVNLEEFNWEKQEDWTNKLSVPFTKKENLASFDIVGDKEAVQLTENGLKIRTESENIPYSKNRNNSVAIWSKNSYDGRDVYVELEYKPMKKTGNVNLYTHVAGKFREDYFGEHGYNYSENDSEIKFNIDTMSYAKKMQIWEEHYANPTQVRYELLGYHFNFYRNMINHRNDQETFVASFITGLEPSDQDLNNVKNEYGVLNDQIKLDKWHKLQLLKKDGKLTCAIDGEIVVDESEVIKGEHHNEIINFGRLGLRFSQNTSMKIRNFNAYFTPNRFSEK